MISTKNLREGATDSRQAVTEAPGERVVPKPVPESQTQDPRKYHIEQLKRRYSAKQNQLQNGTTNLSFHLKPSDPDFPFELDYLDCEIQVPASYPGGEPRLCVKNTGIPRGFSVNIERGWEKLVQEREGATLLALANLLDKNLEAFLSQKQTETVTLVSYRDTRHLDIPNTVLGADPPPSARKHTQPKPEPIRPCVSEESFTKSQVAQAKARRAQETRQLDSRMRHMSHFQKSADGIVYTLPLEPKRRAELPTEIRAVQSVQLIIPLLYPLQSLKILLNDVESKDAELLEESFARRAAQQNQMSLMSHLNYLTQNIHKLAKQAEPPTEPNTKNEIAEDSSKKQEVKATAGVKLEDKNHIHVIPRPPEWNFVEPKDSESELSWDSEDESDDGGATVTTTDVDKSIRAPQPECGTSISFPSIELHSIELFQISILSINVKCERCRTINEVIGLRPNAEKPSSCKKCATAFAVQYRPEIVHHNSVRAGFIDCSGCTVADMLPSTFIPTCGRCSTASTGLVSVRGEVTTNICRECHGKLTFKIPDVKFIAITHGSTLPPTTGPKRHQEKLGLHAGESLPDRGACPHYKRSYRWFRFSCCNKVHPCDKCHDEAEDHTNEWANRMICGWCSREQNYAVEACTFCGRSVIGKKGRGFWEGGKGTRDKTRMSRKDKRKYRRVGGGEAKQKD